jgi:hypothetical protein
MPAVERMKTRVDTCLNDGDMPIFHQDTQLLETGIDWKARDYDYGRIEQVFRQVTPTWNLQTDHIIPDRTPISNQGSIGSCVANAWCDMMEVLAGLESGLKTPPPQLSRLFLYWISRYLTGDTAKDKGTYLRSAAHQLKHIGIFEEEYFPYDDKNVFPKKVEADLYTMASNNRLEGFYRLGSDGEQRRRELELALRTNHPVVFGTPVGTEFQKYRGGGEVLHRPESWTGRHAMMIIGLRFRGGRWQYLLRNSWGLGWGDDGKCWVDEDYIIWDETEDLWVGTKMPALI